jgi:hypothetical protein
MALDGRSSDSSREGESHSEPRFPSDQKHSAFVSDCHLVPAILFTHVLDQSRPAQYPRHSANQGHANDRNKLGFCLQHGYATELKIEIALNDTQRAEKYSHSEATFNHSCYLCRCLCDPWKSLDRSSDTVSHPTSIGHLSNRFDDIFMSPADR